MRQLENPWLIQRTGKILTLKLTPVAYRQFGRLYFVDLPAVGAKLKPQMNFATLEGEHWLLTLASPVAGTVVATNPELAGPLQPARWGDDWLVKVREGEN